MPKLITNNEFLEKIKQVHGTDIEILEEYKNRRIKILVKHKCGYQWNSNPETLSKGHGCPICAGNKKKTTAIIKKEVYSLVGCEYEVVGEYINTHTPILFKHNKCGKEFVMSPKAFIHQGQRCPNERYFKSAQSNSTPFENVIKKVKLLGKGDYEIVGEYMKASKKTTFIHKICGKEFEMAPTRFINGGIRCPHCYRSKGEEVIRDYLLLYNIEFKEQYKIKECRNMRPLPFDFAIFNENKLKYLIEYDGSQHYSIKFTNSSKEFERIKFNDQIKNDFCKKNNIILIRLKYVRNENPNIFKYKVLEKLENEFARLNMTIPSQAETKESEGVETR